MLRLLRRVVVFTFIAVCCSSQSTSQTAGAEAAPPPPDAPTKVENGAAATSSANANVPSRNTLGEALSLYRKGDFTAAIAKYQDLLQKNPRSPDAYAGLVRVYLKQ